VSNFNILVFVYLGLTNMCYDMLVHDDEILEMCVDLIVDGHKS